MRWPPHTSAGLRAAPANLPRPALHSVCERLTLPQAASYLLLLLMLLLLLVLQKAFAPARCCAGQPAGGCRGGSGRQGVNRGERARRDAHRRTPKPVAGTQPATHMRIPHDHFRVTYSVPTLQGTDHPAPSALPRCVAACCYAPGVAWNIFI